MFVKRIDNRRNKIETYSLDSLVPENHLVRKIEASIDFSFIYDLVQDYYSENRGRPCLDPVILFKIVLIKYIFGIKSIRQTINEIETNVAYRWFLNYGINDKIPHFTTFGKNYSRRFKDKDIFEKIFSEILEQAHNYGYINSEAVFIDSTHVKANANKKKFDRVKIEKKMRSYQDLLEKEINRDRKEHDKKELDFSKKKRSLKKPK